MYPFASVPENLIAFCAVLGRDHGFRIGAGEVHDAARALEVVDLPDEHAVRHALRPILSGTLHDVTVFDQAFTDFFFPGPAGVRQDQMPSARGEPGPGEDGGEALAPRWLRRPRRTPRFVLLIDGSRSMSAHARDALRGAVALAGVTGPIEVFTFSTALQRVTGDVRGAAAGELRHLESDQGAWGGGTRIGECLREFLRTFGERLLGRDTVVIIASDGLDVGEPDTLRGAMRELHRRSAGIVWLNPLLETPEYEPTACGMSAARPYVTTFASVTDEASFARLSRVVRVRV